MTPMAQEQPTLTVIVPVYNEGKGLSELKRRLDAVLDRLGEPCEVIAVDDGSDDDTLDVLKACRRSDARWRVLSLSRNFGHAGACTAGLEAARGRAVVFLDADLQDPPELILTFVEKWREGFEVVYGRRTKRLESPARQFLTAGFYRMLGFISETPLPVDAGIFSLIDRRVVEELKSLPERHRYLTGLRGWVGFRQAAVPYKRERREGSPPKQTQGKLFGLAADAFLSFSILPLRLSTLVGAAVSCVAFAASARILYLKVFTNRPIVGWTSIMLAVLLMGGMILVALGIIGEYVGRIYDEVKRRPLFIVKEALGFEDDQGAVTRATAATLVPKGSQPKQADSSRES